MLVRAVVAWAALGLASHAQGSGFQVFWNVPSEQCRKHNVTIDVAQYGMVQNTNDVFYGDKVTILYNPGAFPYYKGEVPVNGGIPQKANMTRHIDNFKAQVQKQLPKDFKGVAVLDFESYYPSLMMSYQYKAASHQWVQEMHPDWSHDDIIRESYRTFNQSSRELFQSLLMAGRALRPEAQWGYYHYPYCHNYGPTQPTCQQVVTDTNDRTTWLYQYSGALYPSIYIFKDSGWDPRTRRRNAETRIQEAIRVRKEVKNNTLPIYPYFWYRYHDNADYLSPIDVVNTIGLARMMGIEGVVVWGSNSDVNSTDKCLALKRYVDEQMGPFVAYTQGLPDAILQHAINSRRTLKKLVATAARHATRGRHDTPLHVARTSTYDNQQGAPRHHNTPHEAPRHHNTPHETPRNHNMIHEAPRHHNTPHETPRHHNMIHETPRHHNTPHETARHHNTPHETDGHHNNPQETPRHHNTPHETPRHHNTPHETPRHHNTPREATEHLDTPAN